MSRTPLLIPAVSLALAAGAVHAEPGLGDKVYAPSVEQGVTEFETRGGTLVGRGAGGGSGAVFELEHGFSDRVSAAVVGEWEREPGKQSKLDAIGVETVIHLGVLRGLGIDTGLYLEYEQRLHAESGKGEARLLFARTKGRFEGLLNLTATKALTDKSGQGGGAYGYAAQATWKTAPGLRLGLEAFGNLGAGRSPGSAQAHYVGPTVVWESKPRWLPVGLELQTSYLFAAGAAQRYADGEARVQLSFERQF